MSVACLKLEENLRDCICTSADCERRARCCDCVRNHRANGNLPVCLRP